MRTEDKQIQLRRKRRRKNKGIMGYFCLFISVFAIALFGLSFFVKSYSPDVDVSIGNNDSLTLSETDMNVEVKSVDERLKWIQMEDEMPSVAIREAKESTEKILKEKNEKKNSVVVDVGIYRDANNQLTGDVDYATVAESTAYISPVPGGVGPMTIASLMLNASKVY